MRSMALVSAARRSLSSSAIAWRRICEPAPASSGAVATSDWLSSESCDAAMRLGRSALAISLKLAPKRATAKMATPLWVTANIPMSRSPSKTDSATPFLRTQASVSVGREQSIRYRSMREVRNYRIRRELIVADRRVAGLAEFREIDLAPVHLADFREAAGDRQIDRAHGDLKADIFLGEVAAVIMVAENDHGPCTLQEVASVGQDHFAAKDLIDSVLAPVESADQDVLSRRISPFTKRRHCAKRHWIVRCP